MLYFYVLVNNTYAIFIDLKISSQGKYIISRSSVLNFESFYTSIYYYMTLITWYFVFSSIIWEN